MTLTDEDGQILEHIGVNEESINATLETDGMGREWLRTEDGKTINLRSFLEDALDEDLAVATTDDVDKDGEEYHFHLRVDMWRQTGDYKND